MIVSEIMFFFSFFWGLFHFTLCLDVWTGLRWPFVEGIPAPWGPVIAGTYFLILSSLWISESKVQFLWSDFRQTIHCLICTLWCGLMFLFIQKEEFLSTRLTINNSCEGSIFFLLTGFHCIHVIIGILFILTLFVRLVTNTYILTKQKCILYDVTVWYWHFVDYVWIFLFIVFYLYLGRWIK